MAEEFEIVRNANPSLVKQAQADVGVVFEGVNEVGRFPDGVVKKKENAKSVKRIEVPEYDESDNEKQPDTNPFSAVLKEKNDKARQSIIPLLNPMSKSDGIRLNSIELEVSQDIEKEEAKPEPDQKKLDQLELEKKNIETKRKLGDEGRKGIVFPPKEA